MAKLVVPASRAVGEGRGGQGERGRRKREKEIERVLRPSRALRHGSREIKGRESVEEKDFL